MKSYSSIWIHLIWTTKDRIPLLHKRFRLPLFQYIKEDTIGKGIIVDTINGIEDHIHCLVRLVPAQKLSDVVKQIKGSSSRWINKNSILKVSFKWQVGYGAISVSPADLDKVRKYIKNQELHHRKWKLDTEMERFRFYWSRERITYH